MPDIGDILALAAAGGSTGSSAGTSDLNAFNNTVLQSDPYGIAGRGIASWQPNMQTWSPATQGISSFAKSFLSGFLGNQARADASDQLSKVATVFPQLNSDPMHVAIPEGVDPEAFNALRLSRIDKNQQRESALADMLQKVGIAGLTKKAEVVGEQAGYDALGQGAAMNPDSPQGKLAKEQRGKADNVESEVRATLKNAPIVQAYQVRQSALQNILANANNNTTYGDLALINGFQKVQDPEGSVREGDVSTIQGAQDRLSKFYGDVSGWFSSDGRLKPEYRKQIAETAANTTNAYGKIYQQYVDDNLATVKSAGGDPLKIPYVPHKAINVNDYFTQSTTPKHKESDLIAQGYTKGADGWIPPLGGVPRG